MSPDIQLPTPHSPLTLRAEAWERNRRSTSLEDFEQFSSSRPPSSAYPSWGLCYLFKSNGILSTSSVTNLLWDAQYRSLTGGCMCIDSAFGSDELENQKLMTEQKDIDLSSYIWPREDSAHHPIPKDVHRNYSPVRTAEPKNFERMTQSSFDFWPIAFSTTPTIDWKTFWLSLGERLAVISNERIIWRISIDDLIQRRKTTLLHSFTLQRPTPLQRSAVENRQTTDYIEIPTTVVRFSN